MPGTFACLFAFFGVYFNVSHFNSGVPRPKALLHRRVWLRHAQQHRGALIVLTRHTTHHPRFSIHLSSYQLKSSAQDFLEDVVTLGRAGQGVVGELTGGFLPTFFYTHTNRLIACLATQSRRHAGAMLWSLRFRSARGGFYFHAEPWGFQTFW